MATRARHEHRWRKPSKDGVPTPQPLHLPGWRRAAVLHYRHDTYSCDRKESPQIFEQKVIRENQNSMIFNCVVVS